MTIRSLLGFAVIMCAVGFIIPNTASAQLSKPGEPGCEQCKPGEYRLRIEDVIPAGPDDARNDAPPCGDGTSIAQAVADAVSTALKTGGGILNPNAVAGSIANVANALHIGGDVGTILGGAGKQYSACKAVCVVVPQMAIVTATHFEIAKLQDNKPGEMEVVDPTKPHFDFGRVDLPVNKPGVVCTGVANWAYKIQRPFIMDAYFTSTEVPIEIR